MNHQTALIIGATGLTGHECLLQLLNTPPYSKVTALTRKPLPITHPRLENVVVDFDKLDNYTAKIKADDIYCAIGTTIGKAGSQAAFTHVDYEIPLQVAQIAKANGAQKLMLVSSMGADAKSGIFYSRTKGQLEEALKKLGFESLLIFRPSILLGDRKEKRRGEEIGRFVAEKMPFLFSGPLKKYRGTPVSILSKAMINGCLENSRGVRIIENDAIFVLAEK
jgi:uncharacterized protein YbjT (DUF2867 family)